MKTIMSALVVCFAMAAAGRVHAGEERHLRANEYLFPGQEIVQGCYHTVTFGTDGNLVVRHLGGTPVWTSGTANKGAAYVAMQGDGNLVIRNWAGSALWSSHTNGHSNSRASIQGDRNFVIYNAGGSAVWASNTVWHSDIGIVRQPCNWDMEKTLIKSGFDMPGGDIGPGINMAAANAKKEMCASWCVNEPRCVAFTFVPAGVQGSYPKCWLKDRVSPMVAAPSNFASGQMLNYSYFEGDL